MKRWFVCEILEYYSGEHSQREREREREKINISCLARGRHSSKSLFIPLRQGFVSRTLAGEKKGFFPLPPPIPHWGVRGWKWTSISSASLRIASQAQSISLSICMYVCIVIPNILWNQVSRWGTCTCTCTSVVRRTGPHTHLWMGLVPLCYRYRYKCESKSGLWVDRGVSPSKFREDSSTSAPKKKKKNIKKKKNK